MDASYYLSDTYPSLKSKANTRILGSSASPCFGTTATNTTPVRPTTTSPTVPSRVGPSTTAPLTCTSPLLDPATCAPPEVASLVRSAHPGLSLLDPITLTVAQLQSLGSCVVGWQVMVESTEGRYVGTICWLLAHCARLGLEEVSRPSTGLRRAGLVLLYYRCVKSVTLLAKRTSARGERQCSTVLEQRGGRSLLMRKLVPPHLAALQEKEREEEEAPPPPLPLPPPHLSRPDDYVVVDALDSAFHAAIADILRQSCVGLAVWGRDMGRWGELAWLCVASPFRVYLFDMASIGLLQAFSGKPKAVKGKKGNNKEQIDDDKDKASEVNDSEQKENVLPKDEQGLYFKNKAVESKDISDLRQQNPEATAMLGKVFNTQLKGDKNGPLEKQCSSKDSSNQDSPTLSNEPNTSTSAGNTSIKEKRSAAITEEVNKHNKASSSTTLNQLPSTSTDAAEADTSGPPTTKGLSCVFTKERLTLLVHDSRPLCDFLWHRVGLQPASLQDTQATEVYLAMVGGRGGCPAFAPTLGQLLVKRLGLSERHLLFEGVRREHQGRSSGLFERPTPAHTLAGMACSVLFLRELHEQQAYDVTADLRQTTALHSQAYLLLDDVSRGRVEQHVVPSAVQQLGRRRPYRGTYQGPLRGAVF